MHIIELIVPAVVARQRLGTCDDSAEALCAAEQLYKELKDSGRAESGAVVTVTPDGQHCPVASFTDRRITGTFTKQVWGGRKGDDAIFSGTEEFDATDYVLRMPLQKIHRLVDHDDTTDVIGLAHVDYDGPFEVDVVGEICAYFGIEQLEDLTEENLDRARTRLVESASEDHGAAPNFANQVQALADALVAGAGADIWHDAARHGDIATQSTIESLQADIERAAKLITLMSKGVTAAIAELQQSSGTAAKSALAALGMVRDSVSAILPAEPPGATCAALAAQVAPNAVELERARTNQIFDGLAEALMGLKEYYPHQLGNDEIKNGLFRELRENFLPTGDNTADYRKLVHDLETAISRLPEPEEETSGAPAP